MSSPSSKISTDEKTSNSAYKRQKTSEAQTGWTSSIQSPSTATNTLPIGALSPFSGSKWSIVARVTYKSDIVLFKSGNGSFFTIHLLDVTNNEIRCSFYTDACERFFDVIEVNKVYRFSSAKVKDVRGKKYTSFTNSYELTFDASSVITEEVDNGDIKQYKLNLTKIEKLSSIDPDHIVDVMGFVKTALDIQNYQTQSKTSQKRDIIIFDDSGAEVRLTLWDNFAMSEDVDLNQKYLVVAIKNVRVSDYMGRSLSTTVSSCMVINPSEGESLRKWLSDNVDIISKQKCLSERPTAQKHSIDLENRLSIKYLRDSLLGRKEDGDIVSLKVSIIYINKDRKPWYDACPTKGCNKKVTKEMDRYHCTKCLMEIGECAQRFVLSCICSDYSGQLTLTFYNEQAEKLLGVTASQLNYYLESGNLLEYDKCFSKVLFKSFSMSVKLTNRILNDNVLLESNVLYLEEVSWQSEGAQLLRQILKL